jgi:Na+:H+ antiporter, NhaA family
MKAAIQRFIQSESLGGVLLAVAALAALLISNSPLAPWYQSLLTLPGEVRVGGEVRWALVLSKPLHVWVNDLWMAMFFLLVGLEIKRELIQGELASAKQALMPAVAALGGMVVPGLIYAAINIHDAQGLRGWAIPSATDIAFTLAVLMLLGSRVPASLKVFVTAVAIIDDLGAIVIIALFYTSQLSLVMLVAAGALGLGMFWLNRLRVERISIYLVLGLLMWLCVLKSGVHATLAGVVTALAIPMKRRNGGSPLLETENALHPWVVFVVLPVFAFVNAGVSLKGVTLASLTQSVPLGIAAGLVFGKTIGVFSASWLMVRLAGASWPQGSSRAQFLAVCVLCGIGFTMSLFIGSLAFEEQGPDYQTQLKLGVLMGSSMAALLGSGLFLWASGWVATQTDG